VEGPRVVAESRALQDEMGAAPLARNGALWHPADAEEGRPNAARLASRPLRRG
jgi:hypothetical protein